MTEPTKDPRELLRVSDVAHELKVRPDTVRRYIRDGRLHAERYGPRRLMVRRGDMDALVQLS